MCVWRQKGHQHLQYDIIYFDYGSFLGTIACATLKGKLYSVDNKRSEYETKFICGFYSFSKQNEKEYNRKK